MTLEISGDAILLEVDSLEIERRRTKDGTDDVYCSIELSSEEYEVTRYLHLSYVEYNGREWYLEDSEPYQEETVTVREIPDRMYDWSMDLLDEDSILYGELVPYVDSYDADLDDNEVHYVIYIDKTEGIMHTSGPIVLDYYIFQRDGKYFWGIHSDFENLETSWDVGGRWSGRLNGLSYHAVSVDMNYLDAEYVDCTWEYSRDTLYGNIITSSGDGYDCTVSDETEESIHFFARYDSGMASSIDITFYADGTATAEIGLGPTIYLEREW